MASSMIHLAVANELNKTLSRDRKSILIGSIAPDISKELGRTKLESHFLDNVDNDIPNINKFLDKYRNYLDDDFVLGYYIHLYTDYLWVKYFLPDFEKDGIIYKLNGDVVEVDNATIIKYIYNDYTNLNIKLIDEYDLNLDIFYENIPVFKNIIKEIPMHKIYLIVDKAGIIVENTKVKKAYIFNMDQVNKFIKTSVDYITSNLKELGIIIR